jgi:HD-like signal output (HDOD) protein/DNA-binding response OmpR family regulator
MSHILIVDDTPFWREITSDLMRKQSHTVSTANNAVEARGILSGRGADLVILDVELPHAPGHSLLEQIRRETKWNNLPVVVLTGDVQKEHVLLAKRLGALDYLLKQRFSPAELIDRVQRRIETAAASSAAGARLGSDSPPIVLDTGVAPATSAIREPDALPELLTRDKTLARARRAMTGRTLPGVLSEVMALADSPKMNLSDLTTLVSRDGLLSARVLHAAKSAANVNVHGISSLADAVRVVGCATIRNIAATIGVFNAMPEPEKDGFSPIRTWQHSLVVAKLCERLAPADLKPAAYLAGLCHELGQILFRTHFGPEYRQVLDAQKATGQPLHRVEIQILGATHGEVSEEILHCLGLPDNIRQPIDLFHHATRTNAVLTDPLAKVLRMADAYATGILLASSEDADLCAYTQEECQEITGRPNPVRPNDAELREEMRSLTVAYARVPAKEHRAASAPFFPQEASKFLVVRDANLSVFDPITTAMESLGQIIIAAQLPTPEELSEFEGLIVIARNTNVPGLTVADVQKVVAASAVPSLPVLFLSGKQTLRPAKTPANFAVEQWPIPIADLARFVRGVQLVAA